MKLFDDAPFGEGPDSVFAANLSPALNGAAAVCKQVDAPALTVGVMTQLKFYVESFTSSKTNYAGKLFLEVSNDFSVSTTVMLSIG